MMQQELIGKVEMVEGQTSYHESRILSLETSLYSLSKENKMQKSKLNDLEGRSHCNNSRIVGIPGGYKGKANQVRGGTGNSTF